MFGYVIHRLFIMVPTLLVISFLVFLIIQAPPVPPPPAPPHKGAGRTWSSPPARR